MATTNSTADIFIGGRRSTWIQDIPTLPSYVLPGPCCIRLSYWPAKSSSGAARDPIFESGYDDNERPLPGFGMLRDLESSGEAVEEDMSDEEVEDVDFQS